MNPYLETLKTTKELTMKTLNYETLLNLNSLNNAFTVSRNPLGITCHGGATDNSIRDKNAILREIRSLSGNGIQYIPFDNSLSGLERHRDWYHDFLNLERFSERKVSE